MTPTTSTSPITLLNPAAPSTGKTAGASESEAASDAALSGFELLLGAAQQLQQTLPAQGGKDDAVSKGADSKDDEGGNALPQLGTILPSLSLPQAAQTENSGQAKKADDSDKEKKNSGDQAAQSSPIAIIPNFAPIAPTAPAPNGNETATAAASNAVDTAALAQITNVGDNAGNGGKAGRAANAAPAQASPGADSGTGNNTLLDATKVVATASTQNAESIKPAAESDFDALVKHFEAPASTQAPAAISGGDNSSVSQMSRTYSSAANNSAAVQVPVGGNGWSDAVADKVMWFSANKVTSAEIHLNPPDLGPLQVRISTQHDQASVMFTSQHAAVRDALDQALPRLRDMMGSQGMHLLDVSVGGQSAQQQSQQQFTRNDSPNRDSSSFAGFFGDEPIDTKTTNVTSINTARLQRSGVDAYA